MERFKTDLRPVAGRPADEMGFAVLGRGTIEALEDVTAQPDAASRLAAQWFVRRVLSQEPGLLAPENPYIIKPSPEERQRAVVRLEHLARRTSGDGALYYGEAVKQYGRGTLIQVQAWLRQTPQGLTSFGRNAGIDDGDRKGFVMRSAKQLVRFGGREFWLMREYRWEHGEVVVFDVGGAREPRAVARLSISAD